MAVLVDAAVWEWRGARWAHLVSDESHDELHRFAERLGKRRLGFQGDHYDIEAADRHRAIELGAEPVDSRVLVRRLKAAGLRRRRATPEWRRLAVAEQGSRLAVRGRLDGLGEPGGRLGASLLDLEELDHASRSAVFVDQQHLAVIFDWVGDAASIGPLPSVDEVWAGEPRLDGERSLEVLVRR